MRNLPTEPGYRDIAGELVAELLQTGSRIKLTRHPPPQSVQVDPQDLGRSGATTRHLPLGNPHGRQLAR
ncbi:MAG: hypothetical protein R3F53_22970 [Gammaproteobacteria bacterium]